MGCLILFHDTFILFVLQPTEVRRYGGIIQSTEYRKKSTKIINQNRKPHRLRWIKCTSKIESLVSYLILPCHIYLSSSETKKRKGKSMFTQ